MQWIDQLKHFAQIDPEAPLYPHHRHAPLGRIQIRPRVEWNRAGRHSALPLQSKENMVVVGNFFGRAKIRLKPRTSDDTQ